MKTTANVSMTRCEICEGAETRTVDGICAACWATHLEDLTSASDPAPESEARSSWVRAAVTRCREALAELAEWSHD